MPPKRELPKAEDKVEANDKKKVKVGDQVTGQAPGLSAIESIYHDRLPQGRALNRWDAEAERDLIMACLTSENNNYPTINWPRVKVIMDDRGYKFSRSALDQRWSKTIMKEWRERRGPGTLTDFVDPETANNTPARKRGRVQAIAKAKQNERLAAALAVRDLANSSEGQANGSLVDNSLVNNGPVTHAGARGDPGHLTRSLEQQYFGNTAADADDVDVQQVGQDTKKYLMQPPPNPPTTVINNQGNGSGEASNKPSPGDLAFLQQCDLFRVEEGNKVIEEPLKKRRAPRRSKAEMEKVRADKEAARIKREEERARKQAALNAQQNGSAVTVKKEKKINMVNLITPPRAHSTSIEVLDDFDNVPLFPGAATPSSQVNSPQTTATPTYGTPTYGTPTYDTRGSTVAPPSARTTPTPAPDAYGLTQGFTTMNYPSPSRNVPLSSFQNINQSSNHRYPIHQNSFNGFNMLGRYGQPMNSMDFNFGMSQHGYMQPSAPRQQNPYSFADTMFTLPPIYDTDQNTTDARVLLDGLSTDFGAEKTTTDRQSTMVTQPAPLAPMDILPTLGTKAVDGGSTPTAE